MSVALREVSSEFDEVAVGVAKVEGLHVSCGAVAWDGAKFNGNGRIGEMLGDFINGLVEDEAEVGGAGGGTACAGLNDATDFVEVDALRGGG